jgi:hypothetical protein
MAPSRQVPSSPSDYTPAGEGERQMQEIFAPAEEPKSELGRYRLLAPKCGRKSSLQTDDAASLTTLVRVSPLCVGAMSIGDQWKGFMGNGTSYEEAEKLLDTYYELGGNVRSRESLRMIKMLTCLVHRHRKQLPRSVSHLELVQRPR